MTVVAFSDPNGVLSYAIEPADYGGIPVVNVTVSNAPTWLFSVGSKPLAAHRSYERNDDVAKLLECGHGSRRLDGCGPGGDD